MRIRALLGMSVLPWLVLACPAEDGAREPAKKTAATAAKAKAPAPDDVKLPRVMGDNANLLFTWLDERGQMKTGTRVADVPPTARERVGVVDLSLPPEERRADRYAFFTDLSAAEADGSYPVVAVSRYDAAKGEKLKVALPPVPEGAVVVYSAEWCGFCKKAKRWLAEKNVPFVERDVEKQPGVSEELAEKLAANKLRGGGVPVIDWEGTLIVGFDQRRLEKLLAARTAGD